MIVWTSNKLSGKFRLLSPKTKIPPAPLSEVSAMYLTLLGNLIDFGDACNLVSTKTNRVGISLVLITNSFIL